MPAPLSGRDIAQHAKKLTEAIEGALDATKRYPQYRTQRFLEALHAAGFDVVQFAVPETIHESSSDLGHG